MSIILSDQFFTSFLVFFHRGPFDYHHVDVLFLFSRSDYANFCGHQPKIFRNYFYCACDNGCHFCLACQISGGCGYDVCGWNSRVYEMNCLVGHDPTSVTSVRTLPRAFPTVRSAVIVPPDNRSYSHFASYPFCSENETYYCNLDVDELLCHLHQVRNISIISSERHKYLIESIADRVNLSRQNPGRPCRCSCNQEMAAFLQTRKNLAIVNLEKAEVIESIYKQSK